MKIGRVFVAMFALIFGISTISGSRGDTQAAARLSRLNDPSLDRSNLAFDYQFIGQGQLSGGSDNTWFIGNLPIRVDGNTQLGDELSPGAFVSLSGRISETHVWFADRIEPTQKGESFFTFNGPLEMIEADRWEIGGHPLVVNAQTILGENLSIADVVLATFKVLSSGKWLALEIKAFDRFPVEPTPLPTPTPIMTPEPTQWVFSNSQPGWTTNPQKGPKKKDPESRGRKDSEPRGKAKGHSKHKK